MAVDLTARQVSALLGDMKSINLLKKDVARGVEKLNQANKRLEEIVPSPPTVEWWIVKEPTVEEMYPLAQNSYPLTPEEQQVMSKYALKKLNIIW